MALSSRCLRYLALAAAVLFMVLGVTDAALSLLLALPLFSLLTVPKLLHAPLLVPLAPALLAVPVGVLALSAARGQRLWRLLAVAVLQVALGLALAALAGWQLQLSFSARVETDFGALMSESLLDAKWQPVYHELRCCGLAGPASFHGSIPTACCAREEVAPSAAGPCATLYSTGCVAPAADRMRAVLRSSAEVHAGAAALMWLCAFLSAMYIDSLKRAARKRSELQVNHEDEPLRTPITNQKF
ncbi:Tetraspanin-12 [Frankliniella fusca]|uniref:Tetraspanin-12 n=1 Tax=Frankliniella fusca TaxID=407009 RepID=A0AAE1LM81_9NEOP|nr:Tetraspanin-12 [Frankliniella fusca]